MMILSGLIFSVPIIFFVVLYAKWLGKNKIYQLPEEEGDGFFRPDDSTIYEEFLNAAAEKEKELPSFMKSIMPILIPIILIFFNTTLVTLNDTGVISRSEEHTSELQSRGHLVCRLLLEKKNN